MGGKRSCSGYHIFIAAFHAYFMLTVARRNRRKDNLKMREKKTATSLSTHDPNM